MEALGKGIALGLILSASIGPVFFALIQTSMQKGFVSAIYMALGIALSDIIQIALIYVGLSELITNEQFKLVLGIVGGIIMITFGILTFIKPPTIAIENTAPYENKKTLKLMLKGFLVNTVNPAVFIFWIGVMSMVSVNYNFEEEQMPVFCAGIVLAIFHIDLLKAFLGSKLKNLLTPKSVRFLNIGVGCILIFFGVRMLYLFA